MDGTLKVCTARSKARGRGLRRGKAREAAGKIGAKLREAGMMGPAGHKAADGNNDDREEARQGRKDGRVCKDVGRHAGRFREEGRPKCRQGVAKKTQDACSKEGSRGSISPWEGL